MLRKDAAHAEATAAAHRRQDDAPWLREQAPQVESMRLVFDEERADGLTSGRSYARPIIVKSARALFEARCLEPRCDGLHDFTVSIMRSIKDRARSNSIRSQCYGTINGMPCGRTLVCSFEISYRD